VEGGIGAIGDINSAISVLKSISFLMPEKKEI
jgi:hypothetical protein